MKRKDVDMKKFEYIIKDSVGIHARPAGMLVKEAKNYGSEITLSMNGKTANATRLMAIMGLGVKCGDAVEVTIDGQDEDVAYEGIKAFFEQNL